MSTVLTFLLPNSIASHKGARQSTKHVRLSTMKPQTRTIRTISKTSKAIRSVASLFGPKRRNGTSTHPQNIFGTIEHNAGNLSQAERMSNSEVCYKPTSPPSILYAEGPSPYLPSPVPRRTGSGSVHLSSAHETFGSFFNTYLRSPSSGFVRAPSPVPLHSNLRPSIQRNRVFTKVVREVEEEPAVSCSLSRTGFLDGLDLRMAASGEDSAAEWSGLSHASHESGGHFIPPSIEQLPLANAREFHSTIPRAPSPDPGIPGFSDSTISGSISTLLGPGRTETPLPAAAVPVEHGIFGQAAPPSPCSLSPHETQDIDAVLPSAWVVDIPVHPVETIVLATPSSIGLAVDQPGTASRLSEDANQTVVSSAAADSEDAEVGCTAPRVDGPFQSVDTISSILPFVLLSHDEKYVEDEVDDQVPELCFFGTSRRDYIPYDLSLLSILWTPSIRLPGLVLTDEFQQIEDVFDEVDDQVPDLWFLGTSFQEYNPDDPELLSPIWVPTHRLPRILLTDEDEYLEDIFDEVDEQVSGLWFIGTSLQNYNPVNPELLSPIWVPTIQLPAIILSDAEESEYVEDIFDETDEQVSSLLFLGSSLQPYIPPDPQLLSAVWTTTSLGRHSGRQLELEDGDTVSALLEAVDSETEIARTLEKLESTMVEFELVAVDNMATSQDVHEAQCSDKQYARSEIFKRDSDVLPLDALSPMKVPATPVARLSHCEMVVTSNCPAPALTLLDFGANIASYTYHDVGVANLERSKKTGSVDSVHKEKQNYEAMPIDDSKWASQVTINKSTAGGHTETEGAGTPIQVIDFVHALRSKPATEPSPGTTDCLDGVRAMKRLPSTTKSIHGPHHPNHYGQELSLKKIRTDVRQRGTIMKHIVNKTVAEVNIEPTLNDVVTAWAAAVRALVNTSDSANDLGLSGSNTGSFHDLICIDPLHSEVRVNRHNPHAEVNWTHPVLRRPADGTAEQRRYQPSASFYPKGLNTDINILDQSLRATARQSRSSRPKGLITRLKYVFAKKDSADELRPKKAEHSSRRPQKLQPMHERRRA